MDLIRAFAYLLAAGAVWIAEGFIFSRFLGFSVWQTALTAVVYVVLFVIAAAWLFRMTVAEHRSIDGLSTWKYLSLAPMVVTVIGSFVSLPILLSILALGRLL